MIWYAKKSAGPGQGLVIDEADGRNVAVAYDEKDAPLLAAAPELLTILRRLYDETYGKTDLICQLDFEQARAAIAKAEGRE